MKISDILKQRQPSFSFEFFTPKTDEDVAHLFDTAATLKAFNPAYISVTWGAGGSTRRKTIDIVCAIKEKLQVETMAHLTCVGAAKKEIEAILNEIQDRGVHNVLALRGDPPKGESQFTPHPDGFKFADELVAFIKSKWKFCVAVAGYPEGHVEAPSKKKDMENLKRKVDAGADVIITQLFFNNADFFRFKETAERAGIAIPIIPGIMPITNVSQIKRFTNMCGAKVPQRLLDWLEPIQEDKEAVIQAGIHFATAQCQELLAQGAPGIHFYTLNRSRSTAQIVKNITNK